MDNVREDLKERNIDLTRIGEATRSREVWRNLVYKSLIVSTLMEERKEGKQDVCPNFALTVGKFVFSNSGNFRAKANPPKPRSCPKRPFGQ